MSTDTDLRRRLRDLADDAPTGSLAGSEVWRSGVRRQRRGQAVGVMAIAAAVVLVGGLASLVQLPRTDVPPADTPFSELAIPREVIAPDPWSEPTATPGPLAAVSVALRRTPDGLLDSTDRLQLFGVSAVDGVARFLDVPGEQINVDPAAAAISPDGTRVAMVRWVGGDGEVAIRGWDVLDTTTGELTELRVADQPEIQRSETYEIAFSGDGRHLLTSFSLTGTDGSHDDSLVAWDVETGEQFVAEDSGHYWLPGSATSPAGVSWTRQRTVFTVDPTTGVVHQQTVPHQLVDAAYSPSGGTLAYVGHEGDRPQEPGPWRLHVLPEGVNEPRQIDVGIAPGQILGWRDETHVVVSRHGPREARLVDVATGTWERFILDQSPDAFMTPRFATALLANDTVAAPAPPGADDPRPWLRQQVQWIAIGLLLGGVIQAWIVIRRRRGGA